MNSLSQPSRPNVPLVQAVVDNLNSSVVLLGPLLMTTSMVLAILSSFTNKEINIFIAPLAISIGLIGGYLQFHSLLVFQRVRDLAWSKEPNTLKYIGTAAFYTATYYILIGALLTKNLLVNVWERVLEKPIEDSGCKSVSSGLIILTLGASLGYLARCLGSQLALFLLDLSSSHVLPDEGPKSLGTEAD